jgi:NADH:ubiquinone oxidoreductase subunit 4 (subunit M)
LLLKIGAYGVYKFIILSVSYTLIYLISSVSLIGGVLTAMVCLQESDLKVIIAYSSIGHIGIACASLLTYSYYGELGSLVIFVAHGFRSSLIFYFSSKFYSITHTRNLLLLKGRVNSAKSLIML